MDKFDFGDGLGLVKAHKHTNGGGWVADSAYVAGTAFVGPNARVFGNASVYGNARVSDYSRVSDYTSVFDNARLSGYARVFGNASVYGNARVSGYASGYASVFGNARVFGYARVFGNASRSPKVLTGFTHTVTITDHHIKVGCQFHLASVWKLRGAAIIKAEGYPSKESREWSNIINLLATAHGCTDP